MKESAVVQTGLELRVVIDQSVKDSQRFVQSTSLRIGHTEFVPETEMIRASIHRLLIPPH